MTTRTAVIDSSVIERAIHEGLRNRGLPLEGFPPADSLNRATSVLASALSTELAALGIRIVTTETLVIDALNRVENRIGRKDKGILKKVEVALWSALDPVLDDEEAVADPDDSLSPLGPWTAEAVRVWDADVLITANPDHLEEADSIDSPVIVSPDRWLAVADGELRAARE